MGILLDILNFVYGTDVLRIEDIDKTALFWGALFFWLVVLLLLMELTKFFLNLGKRF